MSKIPALTGIGKRITEEPKLKSKTQVKIRKPQGKRGLPARTLTVHKSNGSRGGKAASGTSQKMNVPHTI